MADDFYNLKRIYEDYGMPGTQTNMSQGAIARGPSYDTTRDMGGRGGPVNVTGGAPSGGDLFNWPGINHLGVEDLTKIAEQALKQALDKAHRGEQEIPELEAAYRELVAFASRSKD